MHQTILHSTHNTSHDRPLPTAKTPAQLVQITIQSRRRAYLHRHPSYFQHADHELADAVLYARLIKSHQTPEERQNEGRAKGYARVLEADLARGESRLSALASAAAGEAPSSAPARWRAPQMGNTWNEDAPTKEKGVQLWRDFLHERFVRGGDDEFDYAAVDGNEEYDGEKRREEQEKWFEDEEPQWDGDGATGGETGVQDF